MDRIMTVTCRMVVDMLMHFLERDFRFFHVRLDPRWLEGPRSADLG
jgi:hypothetical protein